MNIFDFDAWAKVFLDIERFRSIDDSLNGLQVACSEKPLTKMAFAVDACAETIRRAALAGADALFTHHGMFWGKAVPVRGAVKTRLTELFNADMALYACHLPLDAHPEVGNNAVLARLLGLEDVQPFGEYHGVKIGCKGVLSPALPLDEAARRIMPQGDTPRSVLPFGPKLIRTLAVVSGGAPFETFQAIAEGLDAYITGEPSHSIYHEAMEAKINFLAAGHYATETHGVQAVAKKVRDEFGIETVFIECPTGL